MSSDPKEPLEGELPEELSRLLQAERGAPGPAAAVEARVLSRLEQTLGLPPPTGGGDGGGAAGNGTAAGGAAAGAAAGISKAAAILAASVAFGVGAGAGVLGHARFQAPPAPSVEVRTVVSVLRVVEPAPAPSAAPSAPPAAPSTSAVVAVPARPHAAASPPVDAAARDRALAEENALIARAQAALGRGNVAQARAALGEHAARFPNGQLSVERKLLEAHLQRLEQSAP